MADNRSEHTLDERVELSLLYDFYGALLKDNQRRMFEASVLEDYNLSEIAEDEGITRQGVHDAIKRAIKQLRTYEDKLGLIAKFDHQKMLIKDLHLQLNSMEIKRADGNWQKVFQILDEILDDE